MSEKNQIQKFIRNFKRSSSMAREQNVVCIVSYAPRFKPVENCINYSSILTKLIQVAGRLVDQYASDLFISWNSVLKDLQEACDARNAAGSGYAWSNSYLFGFREQGVDHAEAICCKYAEAGIYNNAFGAAYREIWRLDIEMDIEGRIEMMLYRVDKSIKLAKEEIDG